uniref:Uncharacterized protein n=1 Tax=Knipowitschia caucasica TaxID=637954 RepID=A0AAV2LS02_KNICA
MAAVSFTLCEEQFLCSICLEVFTDPVTTSCGHRFCCICINRHWDCSVRCSCPVCKHDFRPKPQLKVQEIQRSVEQSQRKADAEIQEGLRVFTALLERVQQSADSFKQSIVEKHQKVEEEASQLIEQIQTEISELEQRGAEMEQLWTSGDHLSFVQTFTTAKPAPQLSDWSQKTVRTPSYKGTGAQAVSELSDKLNMEMEAFFEVEFEKAQEFAVEVSLDPKTAHPDLVLSKDLKQVKEKTSWEVGVVKESVDRKAEEDSLTVQKGYWTLNLDDDYKTSDDPPVIISVKGRPKKVGVFVDYDEGLVSFYDVDKESFLYSFTDCCFTENILPFFDPHGDSAPMVLKPVRQLVQHYKK